MSFLCRCYLRKRLFLHIPANFMEFFDAAPDTVPKREVSDSLNQVFKQKGKGGILSDSEKS